MGFAIGAARDPPGPKLCEAKRNFRHTVLGAREALEPGAKGTFTRGGCRVKAENFWQ